MSDPEALRKLAVSLPMPSIFGAAKEWSLQVYALALTENVGLVSNLEGDYGRAIGILQEHPDMFGQWFDLAGIVVGDTWSVAQIKIAAALFRHYCKPGILGAMRRLGAAPEPGPINFVGPFALSLIDAVMIFHLGYAAWKRGDRDDVYQQRFLTNHSDVMRYHG